METLTLDGKRYLKAAEAAKNNGYTADYVGQLCRAGKIDSRLVGRTWYVHEDAIGSHKRTKTRSNKKKTVESFTEKLAAEKVGELSLVDETRNADMPAYRKRLLESKITYLPDDTEEIPYIKQAQLDVEESKSRVPKEAEAQKISVRVEKRKEKDEATTFSGVRKKVPLRGSIEVIDAEQEEVEEEEQKKEQEEEVMAREAKAATLPPGKRDFLKRLKEKEVNTAEAAGSGVSAQEKDKAVNPQQKRRVKGHGAKGSVRAQNQSPIAAFLLDAAPTTAALAAVVLFVGSIMLQTVWVFDSNTQSDTVTSSYEVASALTSLLLGE